MRKLNFYSDVDLKVFIDWIHSVTPERSLKNQKDLIINSTLDSKIQNKIENSVRKNMKNIDKNIQYSVVVMDYNGAIRGLLGGRNWHKSKFNRATQSKRQLGSVSKLMYILLH